MAADNKVSLELEAQTLQFIAAMRAAADQFGTAMKGVEGDAKKAGDSVENSLGKSFRTLDVRPIKDIEAELARLRAAYDNLRAGGASVEDLARAKVALKERTAELNAEMGKSGGILGGLRNGFSSVQGALAALGIGAVGEKFLSANLAAEKLQKSLMAINGDAGKTAADIQYLKNTANQLGLSLDGTASGFISLSAAAKGTRLEGEATRDLFSSVAGAMSQLGLSSADTERAFTALGQMMSKGTVSAEELKGQLGDVLPGAFQIAARSVGLTTTEFGKLMEQGGVMADEFLPKFAAEVKRTFGDTSQQEVKGLQASLNRLQNQWTETFQTMGQAGGLDILGGALGIVNGALMTMVNGITVAIVSFTSFGKAIGVTAAALVSLDFGLFKQGMQDIGNEALANLDKMGRLTRQSWGLEDAAKKVGEAQKGAAAGTKQAGDAAAGASIGWERIMVAFGNVAKAAADYVKTAKLTEDQNNALAKNSVLLAELSGIEEKQLLAKAEASKIAADGSALVAKALDAEAKTLQAKAIALQEEVKGQKEVSDEKIKAIEEAKKAAEAKRIEADAALNVAESARLEAQGAKLAAQNYGDQSGQLDKLRQNYEAATAKLAQLQDLQGKGLATQQQVKDATEAQAIAVNRYRDALNDAANAIDRRLKVEQASANVKEKGIDLDILMTRNAAAIAQAKGNEAEATRLNTRALELEIQKKELAARIAQAEADAAMRKVDIAEAEARASGNVSEAKMQEIEALRLAAESKKIDAEIADVAATGMRNLADATREYSGAAREAAGGSDSLTRSIDGTARAAKSKTDSMSGGGGQKGTFTASVNNAVMLGERGIELNSAQQAIFDREYAQAINTINGRNIGKQWSFAMEQQKTDEAIQTALAAVSKESEDQIKKGIGKAITPGYMWDGTASSGAQGGMAARKDFGREIDNLNSKGAAQRAITSASEKPADTSKSVVIRLESAGQSPVNLYADDEAAATALIDTLKRAGMRAART